MIQVRRQTLVAALALCVAGASPTRAEPRSSRSEAGPAQIACAVEWSHDQPAPDALCSALGRELNRPVRRVEDARTVKQGDSIQVLNGDVTWTVIWLRAGKVRAFTRVSKTLASGRELSVLSRVAVTLAKAPLAKGARCVRVEPNGGAKMRSNDLAYPWVELKRCRPHVQEVADPWVQDG